MRVPYLLLTLFALGAAGCCHQQATSSGAQTGATVMTEDDPKTISGSAAIIRLTTSFTDAQLQGSVLDRYSALGWANVPGTLTTAPVDHGQRLHRFKARVLGSVLEAWAEWSNASVPGPMSSPPVWRIATNGGSGQRAFEEALVAFERIPHSHVVYLDDDNR